MCVQIDSKHLVCSMQTMHLSFIKVSTISKQTESSIHLSPCVQNCFLDYGALGPNGASILHQNLRCLQMDRSEIPYDTRHQGVPSGGSKLFSKHMVCSMQTMHLSCIRIITISKLTDPSFHLSLFTQEYQIVRPKWFLRLWCIRHKLCTYHALKLTMSTNGLKQDSI